MEPQLVTVGEYAMTNTTKAMLKNLITLLEGNDDLVLIAPNHNQESKVGDMFVPHSWAQFTQSGDYYSLLIAAPKGVDLEHGFNYGLPEGVTPPAELIKEGYVQDFGPAVFFPVVQKLGGIKALLKNKKRVISMAKAMLDGSVNFSLPARGLAAQGIDPVWGNKMHEAFGNLS